MAGKEERKTFKLRDGPVVIAKLEQMETKIVHERVRRLALLGLSEHRRMPGPEYAEEQPDHRELASQQRILHATCIHCTRTRRLAGTLTRHHLVVNRASPSRVQRILPVPFLGHSVILIPLFYICMEVRGCVDGHFVCGGVTG